MANPTKQKMPEPVRVPPHAAGGLDDELTAQPRLPADELGTASGGEAGLSLEPEDMATRWLSEATEQGQAVPRSRLDSELSLTSGPDTDEAMMPPNFAYENTAWEQTVGLMVETKGAADQLRGPAAVEDEDEHEADLSERGSIEDELSHRSTSDSSIREISLFDRVNEAGDDTVAPDVDAEEAGRHARTTARRAYGRQVEEATDPEQRKLRERAQPPAATGEASTAEANRNEPASALALWWNRAARSVLLGLARALRRIATAGREHV